jgi:predicted membrane protein
MSTTQFRSEIKLLLQAGLLIFSFTVVIGILNGLDVVDFDRKMLMAHVHAGTLGWITLGFIAACLWVFSEGQAVTGWRAAAPRWLGVAAAVSIAFYAYAFYTGNLDLRLAGGSLTLAAIVGFYAWIVVQMRGATLSTPRLGMFAAATTLTIGAVLGVMMGIWLKGWLPSLSSSLFVTHPTTMVVGYLVLAGMALSEWRLDPESAGKPASKGGWAQVVLPFVGGVIITFGALANDPMLIGLYIPFQVIGIIIYLVRLRPKMLAVPWLAGGPQRHYAISAVFLVANVGLITYLIVNFISGAYGSPPDFTKIPSWMIFAMDHAMFIGVMTNGLFGLVFDASSDPSTRFAAQGARLRSWADHVLFWGMNVGVVGFVVGLAQQSSLIKQVFSPIMGVSILLAIVVYLVRLQKATNS